MSSNGLRNQSDVPEVEENLEKKKRPSEPVMVNAPTIPRF